MNLLDKLRSIESKPREAPKPAPVPERTCYVKHITRDLSEFPGCFSVTADLLNLMWKEQLPQDLHPTEILYLDTETTGLGGGAGTLAFEIGIGRLTESGFHIDQYVMRDYPEELPMLTCIREKLLQSRAICTFNGRAFDIPLLRSRFVMNRLRPDVLDLPHIDLLPIARRLWKMRLNRCTLSHLEEEILGIQRHGDLPGSEAPKRFFDYLKTGEFTLLEDVLFHNEQDVASMCTLLARMAHDYDRPERIVHQEDLFSMGLALEKERHQERARTVYRMVPSGKLHGKSQAHLAKSHMRGGEIEESVCIWLSMVERREGGIEPMVELAKYYEHRAGDLREALRWTEKAILTASEPSMDTGAMQDTLLSLQYRYDRLRRRLDVLT